jgi:uncharacterized protein YcnI
VSRAAATSRPFATSSLALRAQARREILDMQRNRLAALAAILALGGPASALAHVIVSPSEATAGTNVTFEMRVPTEGSVPTTSIQLLIPDGVNVSAVEPVAGWKFKFERSGDRIVAITARGRLKPFFFQRFYFRGRVPNAETTLVWKAIQTHRDGEVVRYTGDPGDETASTTTVVPAAP